MAFTSSFVTYYIFIGLKNKAFAPYVSGWAGAVASSIVLSIFLGLQPIIASLDGQPLYFPFDFSLTLPAVVGSHILFFGVVKGIFTGIAYTYIIKNKIFTKANV